MSKPMWRFWIDVGGTFTDCVALSPDGELQRAKVLSSGAVKGRVENFVESNRIIDSTRVGDRNSIWNGYGIRFLDVSGNRLGAATIAEFDGTSGTLTIDHRTLSNSATSYELFSEEPAPVLAMRSVLCLPLDAPLPPMDIRLGTTRGTNALLTRQGATTALVVTKGFRDVIEIGYQNRPRLFELDIEKHTPLYKQVVEVNERVSVDGDVLDSVDQDEVRDQLLALRANGVESLAVCLLHGDRYPAHERLIGDVARGLGFANVSLSHDVSPLIKMVSRAETTTLDAYLNPVLDQYFSTLRSILHEDSRLSMMTSSGGLVSWESFSGRDCLLSGPAGGVSGFSKSSQTAGRNLAIGFDMGGTSTDVSRFDGRFDLEYESEKAGIRVSTPQLAIETVAAGGGSVCRFDGSRFLVGPQSASSDPGPACYGRGGPLAVTDINLFLGRLHAKSFPWHLDREAVVQRLEEVQVQIEEQSGRQLSLVEIAEGFLRVANLNMASAIRSISVARGYDPREYTLCAFGGAAPQHACSVAEELKIETILIHPLAGLLSAYGMGVADVVRHHARGVYALVKDVSQTQIDDAFSRLERAALAELEGEGFTKNSVRYERILELRYAGTDAALPIIESKLEVAINEFESEHMRRFGYEQSKEIEIVALRLESCGISTEDVLDRSVASSSPSSSIAPTSTTLIVDGESVDAPIVDWSDLEVGENYDGPALIVDENSVVVLEADWSVERQTNNQLLLNRNARPGVPEKSGLHEQAEMDKHVGEIADPIQLEVFNNHFQAIATEMGETLRQTAVSVNVKERLDFSCALFTRTGDLVVNAPHIPVHLGAMSETVRSVIEEHSDLGPGDVIVTNDPFKGGSHLPDITVVSPVFDDESGDLIFFTASRAHHAEIGGITPGSMPPNSTSLADEGVLISNFKLFERDAPRFDKLERLLSNGEYPSRNPAENLADIQAQVAANRKGSDALIELVGRFGLRVVLDYMEHIQDAAEAKIRSSIKRLGDRSATFCDSLDDGTVIQVSIEIEGDEMLIDFSGSSDVHSGNLNANRSIVVAAIIYCLRCLVDEDIPLNQGLLAPIKLNLPQCVLNPAGSKRASDCPAIVGGNVETSQRIVDVLLAALDLAAASQGTMNNLLFGDESFGYYETICGGAGATSNRDGANAVHTHMTNTRMTDPEILELRYPVRLTRFELRHGSGGEGQFCGGEGVIREIEFLRELQVTTLSQRRGPYAPFGLHGAGDGALGCNTLVQDGVEVELRGRDSVRVNEGDRIRIETPGGGGWGKKTLRVI